MLAGVDADAREQLAVWLGVAQVGLGDRCGDPVIVLGGSRQVLILRTEFRAPLIKCLVPLRIVLVT